MVEPNELFRKVVAQVAITFAMEGADPEKMREDLRQLVDTDGHWQLVSMVVGTVRKAISDPEIIEGLVNKTQQGIELEREEAEAKVGIYTLRNGAKADVFINSLGRRYGIVRDGGQKGVRFEVRKGDAVDMAGQRIPDLDLMAMDRVASKIAEGRK